MSLSVDRLKAAIFSLVRSALPRFMYAAPRICRVVKSTTRSDGSTVLDLAPEDQDFPSVSGIPLFHGGAGEQVILARGTRVILEFSEGDPARPFCRSWAGGESVAKRVLNAEQIIVGGEAGAEPPAKATSLIVWLNAHVHAGVVNGGGVSGPPAKLALPLDFSATNVEVK